MLLLKWQKKLSTNVLDIQSSQNEANAIYNNRSRIIARYFLINEDILPQHSCIFLYFTLLRINSTLSQQLPFGFIHFYNRITKSFMDN